MPEAPTFWLYVDHRTVIGNGHCPLIWQSAEGTLKGNSAEPSAKPWRCLSALCSAPPPGAGPMRRGSADSWRVHSKGGNPSLAEHPPPPASPEALPPGRSSSPRSARTAPVSHLTSIHLTFFALSSPFGALGRTGKPRRHIRRPPPTPPPPAPSAARSLRASPALQPTHSLAPLHLD